MAGRVVIGARAGLDGPAAPPYTARCALAPATARPWLAEAIREGGGRCVDPEHAECLVWGHLADPDGLAEHLARWPQVRWVQLPSAGVDGYAHLIDDKRTWTSGKGMNAGPVAELGVCLALAGLRGLAEYVPASRWCAERGSNLIGARVTVLGGGAVSQALLRLVAPFQPCVTVVRRHPTPMPNASRVLGRDGLHDALADADVVFLALALTQETVGIMGAPEFDVMQPHAWLVNVARGQHVVTEALAAALAAGSIGGAALDVTDPEPLPETHQLWSTPNCIITPHVACPQTMAQPLLFARVVENVRRFARGDALLGRVDPRLGY